MKNKKPLKYNRKNNKNIIKAYMKMARSQAHNLYLEYKEFLNSPRAKELNKLNRVGISRK